MKHLFSIIEQLDLATEQLERRSPAYARFALLLVDNAVELMLHRICRNEMLEDDLMRAVGKAAYSDEFRERVLGQHFGEKVKFAHRIDAITADERDVILISHARRNELYHRGIRHDDLIHPFAWEYHRVGCDLFAKFRQGGWIWPPPRPLSEAVLRHWGSDDDSWPDERKAQAARSLHARRSPLEPPFCAQLSAHVRGRVAEIDRALDFLVKDNFDKISEPDFLFCMQFAAFTRGRFGNKGPGLVPSTAWVLHIEDLRSKWRVPYLVRPTRRWAERAARIAMCSTAAAGAQRMAAMLREIEPFEELVFEEARHLSEAIEHQVDMALGK
jgi:hypothetical protein